MSYKPSIKFLKYQKWRFWFLIKCCGLFKPSTLKTEQSQVDCTYKLRRMITFTLMDGRIPNICQNILWDTQFLTEYPSRYRVFGHRYKILMDIQLGRIPDMKRLGIWDLGGVSGWGLLNFYIIELTFSFVFRHKNRSHQVLTTRSGLLFRWTVPTIWVVWWVSTLPAPPQSLSGSVPYSSTVCPESFV